MWQRACTDVDLFRNILSLLLIGALSLQVFVSLIRSMQMLNIEKQRETYNVSKVSTYQGPLKLPGKDQIKFSWSSWLFMKPEGFVLTMTYIWND